MSNLVTADAGSRRLVVLVNGLPASGKTTLARALSRRLSLPLLSKDVIKEAHADIFGAQPPEGRPQRTWNSQFGAAAYGLSAEQMFSDYEQTLFTRAVSVAESFGKKISLLVVPARDSWSAIAQTAHNLESSGVVTGLSSKMTTAEQAFALGSAWEAIPEPKRQFVLQIVQADGIVDTFRVGPHTPTMKNEDVVLLHRLWLNVTREPGLENVHHHDILTQALTRFAHDYGARDREDIVKELRRHAADDAPLPVRRIADQIQTVQPAPPRPEPKEEPSNPKDNGSE